MALFRRSKASEPDAPEVGSAPVVDQPVDQPAQPAVEPSTEPSGRAHPERSEGDFIDLSPGSDRADRAPDGRGDGATARQPVGVAVAVEQPAVARPDLTLPLTPLARLRRGVSDSEPSTLLGAAHLKQGLVTAAALAVAAAVSGRATREVLVVFVTVLVGQTVLGWHNDVVDRDRDARHATAHKPVAAGRVETGTVWYAIVIALLVLVPLSLSTGVTAGAYYLASVVVGLLGNVALRTGRFSPLPWAVAFALYPFYLSYGGWGGGAEDAPPQIALVVLAALLGMGVHVLRSLWGLLADDADGWTYYPLRWARAVGTDRLLVLAAVWCLAIVALMGVVGGTSGLRQ